MRVSREIESLAPYVPGPAIGEVRRQYGVQSIIKLASNENPLGTSPRVQALLAQVDTVERYPDAYSFDLLESLASSTGYTQEWITCGNGSNELIDLLIRVLCEPGDRIVTSEYAFVGYRICAQAARVRTVEIPAQSDLSFDLDKFILYFEKFADEKDKIVFLPNPNNPTGTYFNDKTFQRFLAVMEKHPNTLIVLDEAYFEYVRAQDFPKTRALIKKTPNLSVLYTFSKAYGMAGLRLGYLLAHPEIIGWINRIRNPFNINSLAQLAAIEALKDQEFLQKSVQMVWSEMDRVSVELHKLALNFLLSQGNFLTVRTPVAGEIWQEKLAQRGIILRPLQPYKMRNFLRWTIGAPSENDAVLDALAELKKETDGV